MTVNGWLQILVFCGILLVVTKPLGIYMTRVFRENGPSPIHSSAQSSDCSTASPG